jgi:hypothetical protein
MKRTTLLALTAFVVALAVNLALAQSQRTANVPFAFTVDQTPMGAGQYSITEVSDRVLQIRNDSTNASITIIALHEEGVKPQNPRLVFHKYGDRYVLAEVWGSTSASGMELPAGKVEQELRAESPSAGGPAEVVVALR